MLERAERASHIDPLASSYAIMQRACPYCGENPGPGKDVTESLNLGPELENNQDPKRTIGSRICYAAQFTRGCARVRDISPRSASETGGRRNIMPTASF